MSLAPFVASPPNIVTAMLELAEIKQDETLYDLGCGDARIIIEAAQKFGAKAVGVELDDGRYRDCVKKVQEAHLENKIEVIYGNLLEVDLKKADVITLYLLTSANDRIRPNLERDLKKGARVVSHDFSITGWTPTRTREIKETWGSHTLYLYTL
ncbi:MAG: class I SAM-dependent methyltransferase [Candidatus Bathyarchaeota archaeon]